MNLNSSPMTNDHPTAFRSRKFPAVFVLAFFLLTVSLNTCVDPYEADIRFTGPKIVVDGQVTNDPGPYRVTVNQSVVYNSKDGSIPVQDATVYVQDDLGRQFPFSHTNRGVYVSDPAQFRGEEGRAYTLFIQTRDKKTYQSEPATLQAAPEIDTAYTRPVATIDYRGVETTEFAFLARFTDPATPGDYYRWNWARYESELYCKSRVVGELRTAFKNPCCGPCWKITACRGCILLAADNLVNGNTIEYQLAVIPYDSRDDYFAVVELFHISSRNYQFWRTANTQVNNTGGIFDAPPATLPGNLFNPDDPKEQVLGFFNVAGVSRKGVYLKRDYLPFDPPSPKVEFPAVVEPECETCNESSTRTAFRPTGWQG
ncbi:MAG: hypothetical protein KIPDCIKN_00958 [Haliscomenobacter sp.]|nr:hypothetical protein [Haliscomenobacter sp.]